MADHDTDFWRDADHRYLERGRRRRKRVDPFYARVIALAVGGALLIPVALTLRHGGGTNVLHTGPNGGGAVAIPGIESSQPTTSDAASSTALATETVAPTVEASASLPAVAPESVSVTAAPTTIRTSKAAPGTAAPATSRATVASRSCDDPYTVVSGDSWAGIAQRFGVKQAALLQSNGATAQTRLLPGDQLCLPAGAALVTASGGGVASDPPPPTSATTEAPAVTTTDAPSTTDAPARGYGRDEVIAIIRSTWPDELEDRAIAVATRESNLIPTVRNSCCYGLFQIYFSVHRSWLAGMGVTSASQLYDPRTNAAVALALYQRAGGWGPWGG